MTATDRPPSAGGLPEAVESLLRRLETEGSVPWRRLRRGVDAADHVVERAVRKLWETGAVAFRLVEHGGSADVVVVLDQDTGTPVRS